MNLTLHSGPPCVPEGVYLARCYAIVDLGTQTSRHGTQSQKVAIGWELNTADVDQAPLTHWQYYTANLNPKSVLKALLESWRGKKFNAEEMREFRLENVLGTPCYLTVRHRLNLKGQTCWALVDDITPVPASVNCPALYSELVYFDLDHYSDSEYQAVPAHVRQKINASRRSC